MKRYFFDLDNTLCDTSGNDYSKSTPITDRINIVNNLKLEGNHITIWTARGSKSGTDHKNLTLKQLAEWNILYDELLLGKPDYDIYIDDKSFNVEDYYPVPNDNQINSKKEESLIVEKGWGKEIIFANNDEYCGKLLCFNQGKKFSMHYHLLKKETWYVSKGKFLLIWIDTTNGVKYTEYLNVGDVITNERGEPHQLIALEEGEIFEVSTKHFDTDSYRIVKGN
jgi:quercetin dioxygenase-like cupin family protein